MESEKANNTTNSDALDIDWEHLHQLSEDNTEFEMELLQMFAEDLPEHLEALKVAIANNDFESIKHEGHYIKGSSANVGATSMRHSAEKLEQMAKHEQLEGSNKLLSDLQEYLNRLQAFLAANS